MGLLTTDFKYDSVRTEFQVSGIVDIRKLNNNLNEMEVSLARQFDADRIPRADVEFIRTGDLRYVGQGYELRVPLPPGEITPENLPSVWAAFHARHAAEYGHAFEASPIEIVNVRVSGIGRMPKLKSLSAPVGGSFDKARIRKSPCLFRVDGKLHSFETTFYQRDAVAGRGIPPRPRHRAAKGQHDPHSAARDRQGRRARQYHHRARSRQMTAQSVPPPRPSHPPASIP